MSKASEWVENYGKRPQFAIGEYQLACVTDDGYFKVTNVSDSQSLVIADERALELARWIIDTFGEKEKYSQGTDLKETEIEESDL